MATVLGKNKSQVVATLIRESQLLRKEVLVALFKTGGGHYGGCLSVIDIILTLYRTELTVNPEHPADPTRDRFILSKGHAALALYAVLHRLGFFSTPLVQYAEYSSPLEGHPDMFSVPGVDFSTGSLGQGLSVGLGMAHALMRTSQRVWVVVGDGECQEGQVWEAALLASSLGLSRLHAIIDYNKFQEWGAAPTDRHPVPVPVAQVIDKWRAFGWNAIECEGHDFASLLDAIHSVKSTSGKPSVIVAHTVKGKGVSLIERDPRRFHCTTTSPNEHAEILAEVMQ
jgi:transketolase